jgi:hypothetical protein
MPQTRADILESLKELQSTGINFWSDFDAAQFTTPIGEAWSPADNVRHLIKSTLPVTRALKLPKLLLRTLFGESKQPSVSFDDLRSRYQSILAAGATAGKFAPKPTAPINDPAAFQEKVVATLKTNVAELENAARRWSEADLDRYRLPHPLLGKLTVREMLFFTIYHYDHHKQNVLRRLKETL